MEGYNKKEIKEKMVLEPSDGGIRRELPAVSECCPHCETEIEMRWDVKTMGFKAFCPVCGKRLMLCDECQHRGDGSYEGDCDYCDETDSCMFNPPNQKEEAFKVPTTQAEKNEFFGLLVDAVEDWLEAKGFTPEDFPNEDREGNEGEAIIYGEDYDVLADSFSQTLGISRCEEDGGKA